ncbi:hypothetical protein ONZ45_g11789 [Pleurotus djamor]|nr:hypothetical protein ONZ45_g11789 [Pleurotus djamor]
MSSGSSPRKAWKTHSQEYRSGPLESRRTAVVTDNPVIPVVHIDRFLRALCSHVQSELLNKVEDSLKKVHAITQQNIVAGFGSSSPKSSELAYFRNFHKFLLAVNKATAAELTAMQGGKEVEPALEPCYNPSDIPFSEKDNNSRPDSNWSHTVKATFERAQGPGWEDIVVATEFKLSTKKRADNFRKILWNAQHALRNDPRRMFFFGVTVEHHDTRLWFFSRSHIMVSSVFDFSKNYRPLVQFFIGLSFCHVLGKRSDLTRPLEAHGYDPTIERLDDTGKYRIRVGNIWYITLGVLSDFRAESIRGRCTRVWRVYEEGKSQEKQYALKDVWANRRNDTEAHIWRKLKDRMLANNISDDVINNYFMPLIRTMPDDQHIRTCNFLSREDLSVDESIAAFDEDCGGETLIIEPPSHPPRAHPATYEGSTRSGISGPPDEAQVDPKDPRPLYTPRIRDRSVWGIVGETYDKLSSLPRMLLSLCHIVLALQAMWIGAHAIHRDISTGNIIICDDGYARLSDLEYVVFYDEDNEVGSVKTGTPEFIAHEVCLSSYTEVRLDTRSMKMKGLPEPTITFRHNPIHDLESVWRVLMWTILRYSPAQQHHDQQVLKRKSEMYDGLFKAPFVDRHYSLMGQLYFKKLSSFGTADLETWCAIISDYLRAEYTRVEATMPIALAAFQDSHVQVLADLRSMYDAAQAASINQLVEVASIYVKPRRMVETDTVDSIPEQIPV